MKEEAESVHLKDDTSFQKIVKQEQARRHIANDKIVVAINRWKMMQMLEDLRETIVFQML